MTRTTKRYLIGAAVLVGAGVAFLVEERVRGHLALKAWERGMRARGEGVSLAELAPPITNRAVRVLTPSQLQSLLVQSAALEPSVDRRELRPGKEAVLWRLREWEPQPGVTNNWAGFAVEFQTTRDQLAAFRDELTNQTWAIAVSYADGLAGRVPHLAPLKGTAQTLRRATLLALHEHDLGEVVDNLRAAAALTELQRDESMLISQLVRIACAEISLGGSLWQALQAEGWSDAQLAAVQDAWGVPRFLGAMARALELERAIAAEYFQGRMGSARELAESFGMSGTLGAGPGSGGGAGLFEEWLGPLLERGQGVRRLVFLGLWKFAWADQDQLFHHRAVQRAVEAARVAAASRDVSGLKGAGGPGDADGFGVLAGFAADKLGAFTRARHWLSLMVFVPFDRALELAAHMDCRREMGVAAVALKRYRLRHGEWPASLEALVPEFVPEVPRDWMNGEPLRYGRNDDGTFTLYSVGMDGRDDRGDPRPREGSGRSVMHGRDWVWAQPVSEAELEAARDQQSAGRR